MSTSDEKSDSSVPADTSAPEVVFGTKQEYTEAVQTAIGRALAPKLQKIDALQTQLAEAVEIKEQFDALRAETESKGKSESEKWDLERQKWVNRESAYKNQIAEAQNMTESVRKRWHSEHKSKWLMGLASQAGAAKAALADIPALFPADRIHVDESDNGLKISIVDPETSLEQDPVEYMGAWLATKPHLRDAPPTGAGAPGAGPKQEKAKNFDDLSPNEQLRYALLKEGL
jgi:hypothetical protein